jgi:Disulphide bond corrector protein DsbC
MRFLILALAFAQTAPTLQFKGGAAHAAVEPAPAAVSGAAGSKVSLAIDVTPKGGIHVYAPGTKDFIPIELKITAQPDIKAGKVIYPKSETMTFGDQKVPVFEKPFKLTTDATIAKTAKPGSTITVNGEVHLQACTDQICYPPETVPVSWTVTVK